MTQVGFVHSWDVTAKEAAAIQRALAEHIDLRWHGERVTRVGGVDLSYVRRGGEGYAAIVVMSIPEFEEIDATCIKSPITFPYIPGLLSFREVPAVLKAWEKLCVKPQLLYVDGQGIAHPRGCGLAAHLGLLLEIPSIGCAKTRLVGNEPVIGRAKGEWAPLRYKGKTIGASVRTRAGVRPLYVSPGHRIDLKRSVKWVLSACIRYRSPEPIRAAHVMANRHRTSSESFPFPCEDTF